LSDFLKGGEISENIEWSGTLLPKLKLLFWAKKDMNTELFVNVELPPPEKKESVIFMRVTLL